MLRRGAVIVAAALLVTAIGCFDLDPRTSNQGGGSLISAGLKIAQDQIGDLNPDEWQILADNAPTIAAQVGVNLGQLGQLPSLTDDQAAAIVQFLDDNNVRTQEDLERLAQQIDAGQVVVPQILVDLGTSLFTTST